MTNLGKFAFCGFLLFVLAGYFVLKVKAASFFGVSDSVGELIATLWLFITFAIIWIIVCLWFSQYIKKMQEQNQSKAYLVMSLVSLTGVLFVFASKIFIPDSVTLSEKILNNLATAGAVLLAVLSIVYSALYITRSVSPKHFKDVE